MSTVETRVASMCQFVAILSDRYALPVAADMPGMDSPPWRPSDGFFARTRNSRRTYWMAPVLALMVSQEESI